MSRPLSLKGLSVRLLVATVALTASCSTLGNAIANAASHHDKHAPVVCGGSKYKTDVAIYQCLNTQIAVLGEQTSAALAMESQYLSYTSLSAGHKLAVQAQSAFGAYVHSECLGESNPYEPGTIVPIIYGECAIGLDHQRLTLIERQLQNFEEGGEARTGTTSTRGEERVLLPVVVCPTKFASAEGASVFHTSSVSTVIASRLSSDVVYYEDARGRMNILGPVGWSCAATVDADGSEQIVVRPIDQIGVARNNYRAQSGALSSRSTGEYFDADETSACVGCTLAKACPVFRNAARTYQHMFGGPCPMKAPKKEHRERWGSGVQMITDPPGVNGSAYPSGGIYSARSVMTYHAGSPDGSWQETCVVPRSKSTLCTSALRHFAKVYGRSLEIDPVSVDVQNAHRGAGGGTRTHTPKNWYLKPARLPIPPRPRVPHSTPGSMESWLCTVDWSHDYLIND